MAERIGGEQMHSWLAVDDGGDVWTSWCNAGGTSALRRLCPARQVGGLTVSTEVAPRAMVGPPARVGTPTGATPGRFG